jgi:hypothetical protein
MQICDIDITKHKVCSIGTDGNMIYEYPTAKFEYDHNDKMYSIKNKQIEIVCTLNHRLYVQKRNGKNYELIEAKDVMGKMVRFQKSLENAYPDVPTIRIGDVDYDMDAWLQFVGMFISDGHADFNNKCMYILFALILKDFICKNGWFILNKGKTGGIGGLKYWTFENVQIEALKYYSTDEWLKTVVKKFAFYISFWYMGRASTQEEFEKLVTFENV